MRLRDGGVYPAYSRQIQDLKCPNTSICNLVNGFTAHLRKGSSRLVRRYLESKIPQVVSPSGPYQVGRMTVPSPRYKTPPPLLRGAQPQPSRRTSGVTGTTQATTTRGTFDEWKTNLTAAAETGDEGKIDFLWQQPVHSGRSGQGQVLSEDVVDMILLNAIFIAIKGGHKGTVEKLINKKSAIVAQPREVSGTTALQEAVGTGDFEMVRTLLNHSRAIKTIDATDSKGRTALHEAARLHGNSIIMGDLLAKGADIDARDMTQMTPLHAAVLENHDHKEEVVRFLIEHGAEVNTKTREGELDASDTRHSGLEMGFRVVSDEIPKAILLCMLRPSMLSRRFARAVATSIRRGS